MNVPIVEPDVKKDRINLLVDYFTVNRNNHQVRFNMEGLHYYQCTFHGTINLVCYNWYSSTKNVSLIVLF